MASNTTILQLYKKDPIADADDTFNIETMLNQNWDKVDKFAGAVAQRLNEVNDVEAEVGDLIQMIGNLDELNTDTKLSLVAAVNEVYRKFNEHFAESMPHIFNEGTKKYKYGFKLNTAKDGLVFVYEEVL